jgi:hypothetical protein
LKFQPNHETKFKFAHRHICPRVTGTHNSRPTKRASAARLILFCIGCRRPKHKCSRRIHRVVLVLAFHFGTARDYFTWTCRSDRAIHNFSNQNLGPHGPALELTRMQGPPALCLSELKPAGRLLPRRAFRFGFHPAARGEQTSDWSSDHALLQCLGCLASLQSYLHKSNQGLVSHSIGEFF